MIYDNTMRSLRGDRGWLTHFFVRILKLLLRENHSGYLKSDNMQFFMKLLTKKESENILVQFVFLEIFSKMLNKVNGVA